MMFTDGFVNIKVHEKNRYPRLGESESEGAGELMVETARMSLDDSGVAAGQASPVSF